MSQALWRHLNASLKVIVILIAFLSLCACAVNTGVHVLDRDQPPGRRIQTHHVAKGETLFSIAWRYGLDYKELARSNRISPPFTIYPGQVIRLQGGASRPAVAQNTPRAPAQSPPQMATRPVTGTTAAPTRPAHPAARSEIKTPAAGKPTAPVLLTGAPRWQWPARGTIIARFQANTGLNKGIDIAGNLGEPVLAAAAGQVVYAGTGLRGYGKLLIIKHNETFLSAYAHNDTLFVKEGDSVGAGQKIAGMGSSGTDRVKLHFEIRREGTPVDPMIYLPTR